MDTALRRFTSNWGNSSAASLLAEYTEALRFADHHILQMPAFLLGQLPDDRRCKLLGFVARRAVADGHDLHAVFCAPFP